MAIKQIQAPSWKTHTWSVFCDYCPNQIKKLGLEAGEAAENARKEGFSTVSVRVDLPMKWTCGKCAGGKPNGKGTYHA